MTAAPTTPRPPGPPTLDALARPTGGLAMVAMDQRESLRTMFAEAGVDAAPDRVAAFKTDVARVLAPLASGFLVDREHHGRLAPLLPPTCGLIVAADALRQGRGGPVEDTGLDEAVLAPDHDLAGAVALKLLVIWRRDARREARVALAERFVAEARARGVLSVLEPVVRATPEETAAGTWDADAAILEAARELSPLGASLYKAQVPHAGAGDPGALEAACRALAAAVTGPWVVLSQGVDRERFLGAVRAACRGGASGFLAGRALWSDVVGRPDVAAGLREVSVPRLERLVETVDTEATPWTDR
ncbi:hypothetical protein [Cellulomonas endophytica]|uniref:hypothetical protein n=1 Tax=Cellulomonas endophytica TaxID=2494735 RepID=UPI001F0C3C65|nr:hypothetical protein [Cellulomonas endophytica]